MVDVEDANRAGAVIDLVAHAILPAACTPQTGEGCVERGTHPAGRPGERPGDELPRGKGGGLRQEISQGSSRPRGQNQAVGLLSHRQPQRAALA